MFRVSVFWQQKTCVFLDAIVRECTKIFEFFWGGGGNSGQAEGIGTSRRVAEAVKQGSMAGVASKQRAGFAL